MGFGCIKSKIWEIREINWDIIGLGMSSKGNHEIRSSIPLFSLRWRKFWEFLRAKRNTQVLEGQILPLKYPTITKIHPSPFTSSNIHKSSFFGAAGENFENFRRPMTESLSFSAPQAKILRNLEGQGQNFFLFQRRRQKFWEFWKILKPKIFHFAPQIGA